ncbi:MAG: radical SAM protein, partial [Elusimicrobia bacterium]|nr:radical SAM protein [Elusimicrobiota bacterium]
MDAAADRAQEALASSWDVRSIGRARGGSRTTPLTERRWAHAVDSHWHLSTTVRCQHRCIYCYEGDRTGFHDVPLKDAKRLVSLAAAEVPMVLFLGAEPTLNPHMPELIRHAVRLGLRAGISTNALCLADWGYLEELHRAGLDLVEFSFSYPDAETYAKITGAAPANYVRLLRAVENLARWQETLGRSRSGGLFPNIVVNGYTIDRLEDTLRQLTRRLTPGRFILTLLRLHTAPHA